MPILNRCIAICMAKRFDFTELANRLNESHRAVSYRDALHIHGNGDVFLFEYGVVVFWNVDHDSEKRLLDEIADLRIETLAEPIADSFSFSTAHNEARIHQDHIDLPGSDTLQKLAASHGLAQSVKLSELEGYAQKTIEETAHIPRNMAQTGSSQLSRRTISRMRGQLFLVESEINLHYDLLDTPEFFWEYPEVEDIYGKIAGYLEIHPRIEVLNRKLKVIHEMFEMLAEEQKHKHSSMLEWIIIWLIAIEIAIFFVHDLFGWI